jgi:hypothetical protein
VTWKGKARFTTVIGTATEYPPGVSRALRLRFHLERAHLYSFSC